MQRYQFTHLVGVAVTVLSWIVIGLLLLALVRFLIKGNGWLHLN
jgi:tetrahydromethanopterin S-methyltransferase subunit G